MDDHAILVVDDEPRGVELMQRVLSPLGRVMGTTSVSHAREIIEQHALSVVITDQRMPGESGVELLAELATTHETIGRILITAYADLDTTIEAINRARIHAYLSKPCPPAQMRIVVESVLDRVRLTRKNQQLLRDLAARNRQLTEAMRLLRESQRNLEADNLGKSRFLQSVTKEICGPLASILGFTHLLRDMSLDESARTETLSGILSSGSVLMSRLHDVREIAEAESGEGIVEAREFPIAALLQELGTSLAPRTEEAHLEVGFDVAAEINSIHTDAYRLKQLLFYLVEHALHRTQTGSIEVRVIPGSVPDEIEIALCDVGRAGRPTVAVPHRDEPAAAKHSRRASRDDRCGLAMFMGQRISQILGGWLELGDPNLPELHARVILPVQLSAETGVAAQAKSAARPQPQSLLDARVLIVSVNPIEQRVLRSILQHAAAAVEIATHADAAVSMTAQAESAGTPFTALLIDAAATLEPHAELREQLTQVGYNGSLIAIAAPARTSHDPALDLAHAATHVFDAVLPRPIEHDAVIELIAGLADARARPRARIQLAPAANV